MSFAENNPVVVSATAMQDKPDGVTKSPRSGMYADDSDEEEDETESEWEKEKREKHVSDFKLGCVYELIEAQGCHLGHRFWSILIPVMSAWLFVAKQFPELMLTYYQLEP